MIAHIVLIKPKPSLSDEDRSRFLASFRQALAEIDTIRTSMVGSALSERIQYGQNLGRETYEYAAILEFDDVSGLRAYLEHPAHQELGRLFWQCCAATEILDVEWSDALSGKTT